LVRALPIATALACCLVNSPAGAEESSGPSLLFNAYGTLGAVYSSEDHADFVGNLFQDEGAGYSATVSHKVDSRLGLQLTGRLNSRLSAVVQVVVEQEADGDYGPRVEWANVQYEFTPDFTLRVGRMVQPSFMVSEYRKVGFATPWVRPPEEVYRLIPVTNFDGVEISYRSHFGGYTNTLRGTYGRTEPDWADGEVSGEDILTLSNTLEWGDLSLVASLGRYDLNVEAFDPLFDGVELFGAPGRAIARRYRVDEEPVALFSVGGRYDPGHWFLMAEWAGTSTEALLGDLRGAYATAGYRAGAWTPFVSVARAWAANEQATPQLPTGAVPPQLEGVVQALNSELEDLFNLPIKQRSLSLGARWDFASSMALTLQYDYIDLRSDSSGVFTNRQPGFQPGGSASVVSLSFDFVY